MLLTTREAAEYLGYSYDSLKKSRSVINGKANTLAGREPPKYMKFGARAGVRYKQEDLDAWVKGDKE